MVQAVLAPPPAPSRSASPPAAEPSPLPSAVVAEPLAPLSATEAAVASPVVSALGEQAAGPAEINEQISSEVKKQEIRGLFDALRAQVTGGGALLGFAWAKLGGPLTKPIDAACHVQQSSLEGRQQAVQEFNDSVQKYRDFKQKITSICRGVSGEGGGEGPPLSFSTRAALIPIRALPLQTRRAGVEAFLNFYEQVDRIIDSMEEAVDRVTHPRVRPAPRPPSAGAPSEDLRAGVPLAPVPQRPLPPVNLSVLPGAKPEASPPSNDSTDDAAPAAVAKPPSPLAASPAAEAAPEPEADIGEALDAYKDSLSGLVGLTRFEQAAVNRYAITFQSLIEKLQAAALQVRQDPSSPKRVAAFRKSYKNYTDFRESCPKGEGLFLIPAMYKDGVKKASLKCLQKLDPIIASIHNEVEALVPPRPSAE